MTALLDFLRQERIRNAGSGGADDIKLARTDDLGHLVCIREAAHAQYRLLGYLLDEFLPGQLMPRLVETRRPGILTPLGDIAHVDVPDIDMGIGQFDELHAIHFNFDGIRPIQGIDCKPGGDGAVSAHRFFDFFQRFHPEAGPVLQRAPIFVSALVVKG